jgi:hypothetical protein
MSNEQNPTAWAVAVRTARFEGDRLEVVLYAVLASSQDEAINLVQSQTWFIPGEEVGEAGRLSPETAQAIGLQPGQVCLM